MRYAFMPFSTPDLSLTDTLALANRHPVMTADVDHVTAIRLLKDDTYPWWNSGEWIGWTAPEERLPR